MWWSFQKLGEGQANKTCADIKIWWNNIILFFLNKKKHENIHKNDIKDVGSTTDFTDFADFSDSADFADS